MTPLTNRMTPEHSKTGNSLSCKSTLAFRQLGIGDRCVRPFEVFGVNVWSHGVIQSLAGLKVPQIRKWTLDCPPPSKRGKTTGSEPWCMDRHRAADDKSVMAIRNLHRSLSINDTCRQGVASWAPFRRVAAIILRRARQ